jgi:hypothetical protein
MPMLQGGSARDLSVVLSDTSVDTAGDTAGDIAGDTTDKCN